MRRKMPAMAEIPPIEYAKTVDGVNIAYQVRGDGPVDLVYAMGMAGTFEIEFEPSWGTRPLGIEVRAGVHTGEVETIAGKAGGMAVVIGSRIGALAPASEVLASQTVKGLTAGSGLEFGDAGEHEIKGVPDRWRLYRVVDA